ncbi:Uncharacterized protein Adt_10749 [Abeliophyllum distichum]|uniref:Reverse transcriptase domain-containing protein n=1 Tax=Abeliophyllum distichum TaxID=126358 RepID=A0ABD1UMD4_9LAMI
MEKYDEYSGLVDHLRTFVDLMRFRAIPDAIMYRTFSPTLRREARDWRVFLGLKISPSKIKLVTTPLHGFGGATVIPEGTIKLLVTLGTYPASVVIMTSFLLVKDPMAYNLIYGHPLLNATRALVSTYRQVMKFSTSRGVGCVRGDQ